MVAFEAARKRPPGNRALLAAALLLGLSCDDKSSSVGRSEEAAAGATASPQSLDVASVGPTEIAGCSVVENYGPEEPSRFASCHFDGEDRASWNEGDPTPAGPYRCECNDGGPLVPDASDCNDALQRGCNIDLASLPPDPCSEPSEVEHVCWPVRGNPNEWSCRCAAWEPLGVVSSSSCGEAVSQYCGRCASERGSCVRDGVLRQVNEYPQFDCRCGSGEAGEANSGAVDAGGLDAGSGGNAQHIGFEAYGDCSVALALSCGYPAAGERCEAPDPAGGSFTCSADGEGNWSCDCPRFDECWARRHPVDMCDWADTTCVHITHPPLELDRPRVCEAALYEYCQCPED